MLIKDNRNLIPTKFRDLKVGDVFKEKGGGDTFIKITEVFTRDNDRDWNSISLIDGCLDWIHDDIEVVKLKTELRILD